MTRHYRHEIEGTLRNILRSRVDVTPWRKAAVDADVTGHLVVPVIDMLAMIGEIDQNRRTIESLAQAAIDNAEWATHSADQLAGWLSGRNRLPQ